MKAYDKTYENKKSHLADQFASQQDDRLWSLDKTTSNLFRPRSAGGQDRHLDLRSFNAVIKVDPETLLAEVEGLTTYEDFVNETLKYSCFPAVVPELKTITVGGAIAGCGIESSSFRYGLVHETVKEMDVLLSDGTVVTCSPVNAYRDLFFAIPNTFGSLGYILKAVVQLVPAKQYVTMRRFKFTDPGEFFDAMTKVCEEGRADYIDGVVFGKNEMILNIGTFTNTASSISDYTKNDIYYLSLRDKEEDTLSALDYIWRWDPDWFWCSKVFGMQHPLMRRLFGRWMLHSSSYSRIMHFFHRHPYCKTIMQQFGPRTESIIQDTCIPVENACSFLEFFHQDIGILPIWTCPARCRKEFDFCPVKKDRLYLDFGFWDSVKSKKEPGYYNRLIERTVKEMDGFKSLYSTSYYTEQEFWRIYDKEKYHQLKSRYDPNSRLRDLYQKCTRK